MTFYQFMMENHRGENTPAGDLAEDMYRDRAVFPKKKCQLLWGYYNDILIYMTVNRACPECLQAFYKCWSEYMEYMDMDGLTWEQYEQRESDIQGAYAND